MPSARQYNSIPPGPLTTEAARELNRALADLTRALNQTAEAPLRMVDTGSGFTWTAELPPLIRAKITAVGTPGITKTLSPIYDETSTTVMVADYEDFPEVETFRIKIDDEIMAVTAGAGTTTWTVIRGVSGTTPDTHAIESKVTQVDIPHAWTEMTENGAGGWEEKSGGLSGTLEKIPAYEANGLATNTGSIVLMRWGFLFSGDTDREWIFDHCCNAIPAKLLEVGERGRTTLNGSHNDTDTSIHVDSYDGFPTAGAFRICIGGEHMLVIDGHETTTWKVERARDGSEASSHADNEKVVLLSIPYAWQEMEAAPGGGWEEKTGGLSGSIESYPAFERNGNGDVPIDSIVWLLPGSLNMYSQQERIFDWCCEEITARITAVLTDGATLLNGAINSSVASLTVDSAASFPAAVKYLIKIDDEVMVVTAGMGTTGWTVTRGAHGTTAASHADDAPVNQYGAVCDWTEMAEATVGNWTVKSGGLTGESTFYPAYERNGNNKVPVGLIVVIRQGFLNTDCSQEWIFDYCCDKEEVEDRTLSASQNNYAPPTKAKLRIKATTDISITGWSGGTEAKKFTLINSSESTGTITLPHQSASSSASNRIITPGASDVVLQPGESTQPEYQSKGGAINRWYLDYRQSPASTPTYVNESGIVANILTDNARMCIGTRGTPVSIAASGFTADRWLAETQNADLYYEYTTDPFTGSCCAAKYTKLTNTGKFLIVQWLKSCPYKFYNSRGIHSQMALRASKAMNLRFGFLLWSGTADAPTTPHVSAWNGNGTDPTFAASLTGSVYTFAVTTSWANYAAGNAVTFTNLAFALWTYDQLAAGDWIEFTDAFLGAGQAYLTPYPVAPKIDIDACSYHGTLGGVFN